MTQKLVIGSRWSKLALWQANHIRSLLEQAHPGLQISITEITTKGDRNRDAPLPEIGGKGLFTAELEQALAERTIDLAVHSLKDLPTEIDPQFVLGAIPERESPSDVLISAGKKRLDQIPPNSVVGSSSLRRISQLKRLRPDLRYESIRGNVDTRIDKVLKENSDYAGLILAHAGVKRITRTEVISQIFTPQEMLPAPGQGALGIQCRAQDQRVLELLQPLDSKLARAEVSAERSFLAALGAGCSTPIAALVTTENETLHFVGRCLSPDGAVCVELTGARHVSQSVELGKEMARQALDRGFVVPK